MGYKKVVSADTCEKCTQQTVSRNPLFRFNRKMHSDNRLRGSLGSYLEKMHSVEGGDL